MFFGRNISTGVLKACKPVFNLVKCSEKKNVSYLCSNLNINKKFNDNFNGKFSLSSISESRKTLFHNGQIRYNENNADTTDKPEEFDIKALSKGDPAVEHKLKVILLEMEVLRQEGHLVPDVSFLKPEYVEELLNLKSRNSRIKYLQFLFKKSKMRENKKVVLYSYRSFKHIQITISS